MPELPNVSYWHIFISGITALEQFSVDPTPLSLSASSLGLLSMRRAPLFTCIRFLNFMSTTSPGSTMAYRAFDDERNLVELPSAHSCGKPLARGLASFHFSSPSAEGAACRYGGTHVFLCRTLSSAPLHIPCSLWPEYYAKLNPTESCLRQYATATQGSRLTEMQGPRIHRRALWTASSTCPQSDFPRRYHHPHTTTVPAMSRRPDNIGEVPTISTTLALPARLPPPTPRRSTTRFPSSRDAQ
ncbi:hypothetical protein C8Q79DRAFT_448683 [Trametes meyenii]|nr:hypothetical protein C8Q79DRAFT_448683 [Trametes meyenii]